jgi:hypothetical protein
MIGIQGQRHPIPRGVFCFTHNALTICFHIDIIGEVPTAGLADYKNK